MKLSLMLLKHRILFVCSIVCVLAISIIINISSSVLTQSVLQYKWKRGISSYGNFSCGINDISKKDKAIVLQNYSHKDIGIFETYQNIEFHDLIVTLGYVDKSFREITDVKLLSGRFPKNRDEIVVENFIANMLGDSDIIEVDNNNEIIQLKVVGIIENYSSGLSIPTGKANIGNVYPNIICNENNYFKSETFNQSLLINLEEVIDSKTSYVKNTINIYNAIENIGLSTDQIFLNDNLLNKGLVGCKEIWNYSLFFSFIIAIITASFLYIILVIFYKDYRKKLSILNICGQEFKKLLSVVKQQLFLFYLIGNVSGILMGYGIINIMQMHLNFTISYKSGITIANLFWLEINFLCVMLLILRKHKKEIVHYSLAENLRFKNRKSNIASSETKPANKNILKKIKSLNPTYILLFFAVFIISYLSLYIRGMTIYSNPNIPDYQFFSKEVEESEVVNGFTIENSPEKYILENDVKKLQQYRSYITYDLYPDFNSYTILFNKNEIPDYFEKWNSMYTNPDTSYDESIIKKNWPEEFNNLTPVNNVDFIVADNALLKDIIQQYELTIPISQLRNGTVIILFLPEKIQHKNFLVGDSIKIGGISQYENQVIGKQFVFNIAEIVNKPYRIETDYTIQKRDNIVVFLGEDVAKKSNLFKGYSSVSIRLKENIPDRIRNDINNLMYEMANKIQGGGLYSKEEILMDEKIFTTYNKILSFILMTINLLLGSIMVIIMIYQVIKKNLRTYGILRVLGLSFKKNILYLWKSIFKSAFVAYVLGIITTIILQGTVETWVFYSDIFFIAIGQTFILLLLICLLTYSFLFNKNIKGMIDDT